MAIEPNPKQNDAPKTVAVTYRAQTGDPVHTTWAGISFEHNTPVEVPADHSILKKDEKTGLSPVDTNDWFSTANKASKSKAKSDEPETVAAYFAYAAAWIAAATSSGGLKSRWDNELPMRERLGWGSDDHERMEDIMKPKFQALKKAESSLN